MEIQKSLKSRVERSFTRASTTYDAHADVQIEVAARLMARLSGRSFRHILEIGCGTGRYTAMISKAFKDAHIEAIDISSAMIEEARKKFKGRRVDFHVADGECLPLFMSGPFDLITANSVFHWFDDLSGTLAKYKDILGSEGVILFSTFGPDTLWELRIILNEVFGCDILLSAAAFPDCTWLKYIMSGLFRHVTTEELIITREYKDMFALLRSLKATGVAASNNRPLRFTRSKFSVMERNYRKRFGAIKASYQVFLCEAF